MALSKIDPKNRYKYVSLNDPAIDLENSDLEKYKESKDIKYLVFKNEEYPTYFLLRDLTSREKTEVMSKYMRVDILKGEMIQREDTNALMMSHEVFDMCCKEIEEQEKLEKIVSDNFDSQIVQEISNVCMEKSALSSTEKK